MPLQVLGHDFTNEDRTIRFILTKQIIHAVQAA
jgi:hypothetical protein